MKQVKETKTITVDRWEASDGRHFDSSDECMAYEKSLDAAREYIKSIEGKVCHIPFAGWDMDTEESKLFLLKSEYEYNCLADYYAGELMCDTDYWDKPNSYPAVFQVIGRECYSAGYEIGWHTLNRFMEVMQSMNEYLCKKEQLKSK